MKRVALSLGVGKIREICVDEIPIWASHVSMTTNAIFPNIDLSGRVRDLVDLLHDATRSEAVTIATHMAPGIDDAMAVA